MGGVGTRAGMGETQIEIDRRLIRDKISKLKVDLKKIEKREKDPKPKSKKRIQCGTCWLHKCWKIHVI